LRTGKLVQEPGTPEGGFIIPWGKEKSAKRKGEYDILGASRRERKVRAASGKNHFVAIRGGVVRRGKNTSNTKKEREVWGKKLHGGKLKNGKSA